MACEAAAAWQRNHGGSGDAALGWQRLARRHVGGAAAAKKSMASARGGVMAWRKWRIGGSEISKIAVISGKSKSQRNQKREKPKTENNDGG
jgi:hypothetical protein